MVRRKKEPKTKEIIATTISVPAPSGGLNFRDGMAAMPATDAVLLENWIPDQGGIRCRKGYAEWAINLPGSASVGGILPYFAPTNAFPGGAFLTTPTAMPGKLFASIDAGIYDITSSTNAPALAQALSGTANAGWTNSTIMSNAAGTFMLVCSEVDGYYTYDGAAWVKVTLGGGATQVSVIDPLTFVQVIIHKRRAWFVRQNSAKAAYLAADALYGAAANFDFGPVFKHGGQLSYLATWTIDAGDGVDDFLVAVSSNGDVAVYKGTDPAAAATWALVGTWFIGQVPVGRRGSTQFGGDLVLVGADGVYPISYVTRGGADFLVASSKEYTSKIKPAIGADIRQSFTERGWQMQLHPSERILLVNVADFGSSSRKQYAMGTSLNSWCTFSSIPVYSLGFTAGYMFGGTKDGRVLLLFNGYYDAVAYGASSGNAIEGRIIPAFSSFGTPAMEKQFLLVRPVFLSQQEPVIACDIAVNYAIGSTPAGGLPAAAVTGALWGSGLWGTALWSTTLNKVFSEWFAAGDCGFAGTATIATQALGDTTLSQIDYSMQVGGLLD